MRIVQFISFRFRSKMKDILYLQLIWHSVFEIEHLLHSSIDGHAPLTKIFTFIKMNCESIFNKTSPVKKTEINKDIFVKKFIFAFFYF
jgi:hypothetical protein